MARHGAIFNRCRSFSDGHGILYLAEPVSFQAGVLGAADSAFRSKVGVETPSSDRQGPNIGVSKNMESLLNVPRNN